MDLCKHLLFVSILMFASPVSAAPALGINPTLEYKVFKLPKPTLLLDYKDIKYAAYNLQDFRRLLHMDSEFNEVSDNLASTKRRVELLDSQLTLRTTQVSNGKKQLQLCVTDRTRITTKWKKSEADKNDAEAKRRGGLFAIAGWTVAGVSVSVSIGLLIGLLAQ